jgi:hypothetical protein
MTEKFQVKERSSTLVVVNQEARLKTGYYRRIFWENPLVNFAR